MSTAHKPTFKPVVVGSNQNMAVKAGNKAFCARDLPGYLTLKDRKGGQGTQQEYKYRDFKKELLEKERKLKGGDNDKDLKALEYSDEEDANEKLEKKVKINTEKEEEQQNQIKQGDQVVKKVVEHQNLFPQDADDSDFMNSSSNEEQTKGKSKQNENKNNKEDDSSDSDDSDSDSDENDLLMQEFEKIKQQKEEEEKLKQSKKYDNMESNQQQELLSGNPLLADGSYSLKKRWHEDTVFKNQARIDKKDKKRFINDNVRSDFHKKFLSKYCYT